MLTTNTKKREKQINHPLRWSHRGTEMHNMEECLRKSTTATSSDFPQTVEFSGGRRVGKVGRTLRVSRLVIRSSGSFRLQEMNRPVKSDLIGPPLVSTSVSLCLRGDFLPSFFILSILSIHVNFILVKSASFSSVFTRPSTGGLFTGNLVNYAIVSLLFPVINRKRFCNPFEINRAEDQILGREQEISGEASGRNREHFQGRFLKLCNHLTAIQTTTLRRLLFVVQVSAMSCKNQSKSNQIKPNQTIIFFQENGLVGAEKVVRSQDSGDGARWEELVAKSAKNTR